MISKLYLKIGLAAYLLFSLGQVNAQQFACDKLPSLNIEDRAIEVLKDTSFLLIDSADVSQSDWIMAAVYLSCDKPHGYIIIAARYTEYLYQGVPMEVWQEFKSSKDKQNFHQRRLKNQYNFKHQPQ